MLLNVTSLKLLSFVLICTSALGASSFEFNYSTKEVFSLNNKGPLLKEVPNSRVQSSVAIVNIAQINSKKVDTFEVDIQREDRRKSYEKLKIKRLLNSGLELNVGAIKLLINTHGKSRFNLTHAQTKRLFSTTLRQDTSYLIQGIDKRIIPSQINTKFEQMSLSCQDLGSLMATCFLEANVTIKKLAQSDQLEHLRSHLVSLKSEMSTSQGEDFDILGYRQFLNKAESLTKKSLQESLPSAVVAKLLKVKHMIVDERIDTYEYTAIRCETITAFVSKLLKLI